MEDDCRLLAMFTIECHKINDIMDNPLVFLSHILSSMLLYIFSELHKKSNYMVLLSLRPLSYLTSEEYTKPFTLKKT